MLSGPAAIGRPTHLVTLNHAFVPLTALCAITAAAARIPRARSDRSDRTREMARSSH